MTAIENSDGFNIVGPNGFDESFTEVERIELTLQFTDGVTIPGNLLARPGNTEIGEIPADAVISNGLISNRIIVTSDGDDIYNAQSGAEAGENPILVLGAGDDQYNGDEFAIETVEFIATREQLDIRRDADGVITVRDLDPGFFIDSGTNVLRNVDFLQLLDLDSSDPGSSTTMIRTIAIDDIDFDEDLLNPDGELNPGGENVAPVFNQVTRELGDPENTQNASFTLEARDNNGDALTYTIVGGPDRQSFLVDPGTGVVTVNGGFAFDFENPQSADGDNVYEFTAAAIDPDGLFAFQDVRYTVSDVDETVTPPLVAVDDNGNDFVDGPLLEFPPVTFSESELLANDQTGSGAQIIGTINARNGDASFNPQTREITFRPDPDHVGPADFVYLIRDEGGQRSQATVTLDYSATPEVPAPVGTVHDLGALFEASGSNDLLVNLRLEGYEIVPGERIDSEGFQLSGVQAHSRDNAVGADGIVLQFFSTQVSRFAIVTIADVFVEDLPAGVLDSVDPNAVGNLFLNGADPFLSNSQPQSAQAQAAEPLSLAPVIEHQTASFDASTLDGDTVHEQFGISETIDGTWGEDIFIVDGKSTDVAEYRTSADGRGIEIVYTGDSGEVDTLIHYNQIRFNDGVTVYLSEDGTSVAEGATGPVPQTAPDASAGIIVNEEFGVSETHEGTDGHDVFIVDGKVSDVAEYRATADGEGVEIIYTGDSGEVDTLAGFEEIRFDDETLFIADLPLAG